MLKPTRHREELFVTSPRDLDAALSSKFDVTILATLASGGFLAGLLTVSPEDGTHLSKDRIRPQQERIARVLLQASQRSQTFRAIVDELERRDVIVYVEFARALSRSLGGHLQFLAAAGKYRYVRIALSPEVNDYQLMLLLSHELQHALEVAQAPNVRDESSFKELYRQIGVSHAGRTYDTIAARQTEDRVRAELRSALM